MNGIHLIREALSASDVVAADLEAGLLLNATSPRALCIAGRAPSRAKPVPEASGHANVAFLA